MVAPWVVWLVESTLKSMLRPVAGRSQRTWVSSVRVQPVSWPAAKVPPEPRVKVSASTPAGTAATVLRRV